MFEGKFFEGRKKKERRLYIKKKNFRTIVTDDKTNKNKQREQIIDK